MEGLSKKENLSFLRIVLELCRNCVGIVLELLGSGDLDQDIFGHFRKFWPASRQPASWPAGWLASRPAGWSTSQLVGQPAGCHSAVGTLFSVGNLVGGLEPN